MHAEEDTSPPTHKDLMNFVLENHSEEHAIYPITVREIADAQSKDKRLEQLTQLEKYKPQLVESIQVLCKDDKQVIPREPHECAVEQEPGKTHPEETLNSAMY